MPAWSRWIGFAFLLTSGIAGCGGSSTSTPMDGGPDGSADSSMNATDDGSLEPDASAGPDSTITPMDGTVGDDGSMTTTEGGPEGGTTPEAGVEAGVTDGGNGAGCSVNGDCANGHCVSGVCCASACTTPTTCRKSSGATCAGGTTCVYPDLAVDTTACNDNNACTVGDNCVAGVCTGTALNCNDGNPCTDDSCDMVLGCRTVNNTASCDDSDSCTVNDTCSGGLCHGSPMDCSGAAYNDQCNVGVCASGACAKSPIANNTPCNDSNACTTTDVCTNGSCTGSGNSCGANSSACSPGSPPTCTCTNGFLNSNGQCVPPVNECAPNPCVAGASCNDPSSATGDYVCTCPTGFTGDGKPGGTGCTNIDDCVGNPCGNGLGTCVDGINSHTCNCNAGYFSVNGTCVCDMNGTFASQISMTTSWPAISVLGTPAFSAATDVPTKQWAIRQQTYNATGQLVIKTTQCGGTTADLCGIAPLLPNAYTEFFPSGIYGGVDMPVTTVTTPLPSALPNQPYTEPPSATLLGISLTDPLGAWPASNANVGVNASGGQTNGAIWVNNDDDMSEAVTSYSVPPGGIASTTSPNPIQTYPATSTQCNETYAYLLSIKRLYSASRTISSMAGTIASCDSIQGTVSGPDNNEPKSDVRVEGCVVVSGNSEAPCSASTLSNIDGQSQPQHVTSASFVLKRVASNVTCADVRAMTFP